jgi:hypothetical protein
VPSRGCSVSRMFTENLPTWPVAFGEIVCLLCIQKFGYLFSQKASITKEKQTLVLGAT